MKNTKKGKNINKALLMGTALVALSTPQAHAVTSSADMSAVILAPIAIANTPLHFGEMTTDDAANTVTVAPDPTSTRTASGGVSLLDTGGGDSAVRGILTITAATGVAMDVNIAAPGTYALTCTNLVGVPDMTAGTFLFRDDVDVSTAASIVITQTGADIDVPVGATLSIPAGQGTAIGLAGGGEARFFGTYDVEVNYQ